MDTINKFYEICNETNVKKRIELIQNSNILSDNFVIIDNSRIKNIINEKNDKSYLLKVFSSYNIKHQILNDCCYFKLGFGMDTKGYFKFEFEITNDKIIKIIINESDYF